MKAKLKSQAAWAAALKWGLSGHYRVTPVQESSADFFFAKENGVMRVVNIYKDEQGFLLY